jgi:ubiquinone/menaquinone biosynthesis C-methylase UbiE
MDYKSGQYLENNPTYHIEDSKFKSSNFIKILKKNEFNFNKITNVVDIGCGAGEVIKNIQLTNYFNKNTKFYGFDVNKKIIDLANKDINKNLEFISEDFLNSNFITKTDLIICADVFEHVDDYIGFLKKLSHKSNFFLFNIPLDISLRTLLFDDLINKNFNKVGHLHFFNKNIIKLILNFCNYQILDMIYAKNFLNHVKKNTIKKILATIPIKVLDHLNEDLCAKIFGDSLVCLAKSKI